MNAREMFKSLGYEKYVAWIEFEEVNENES